MSRQNKHQILIVNSVPNTTSLLKSSCHDLNVDFNADASANDAPSNVNWDLLIINTDDNTSKALDICGTVRSVKPFSQIIVLSTEHDDAAIALHGIEI